MVTLELMSAEARSAAGPSIAPFSTAGGLKVAGGRNRPLFLYAG